MPSRTDTALRSVIREVAPRLRDAGFRRQARRFNRTTEPGLVQVTEFETGRFPLPGNGPGDYGRFTMRFGVWIDDLSRPELPRRGDGVIREIDCQVRAGVDDLVPGSGDGWWELFESARPGTDALAAVEMHGLPWLDQLSTRQGVLDTVPAHDRTLGIVAPTWPIEVAVLRSRNGEDAVAAELIGEYLGRDLDPRHRRYVVEGLLPAWGLGHLVPPIGVRKGWPRRAMVEFRTDSHADEGAPAGSKGVIVEVVGDGYMVQVIEADGWGNLIGPLPDRDLVLLVTRGD